MFLFPVCLVDGAGRWLQVRRGSSQNVKVAVADQVAMRAAVRLGGGGLELWRLSGVMEMKSGWRCMQMGGCFAPGVPRLATSEAPGQLDCHRGQRCYTVLARPGGGGGYLLQVCFLQGLCAFCVVPMPRRPDVPSIGTAKFRSRAHVFESIGASNINLVASNLS